MRSDEEYQEYDHEVGKGCTLSKCEAIQFEDPEEHSRKGNWWFLIVLFIGILVILVTSGFQLCPNGVCPQPSETATKEATATKQATVTEQATATQEQKPTETPMPTITSTTVVWTPPPQPSSSPTIVFQVTPTSPKHPNRPKPEQPKPQELPSLGYGHQIENVRWNWSSPRFVYIVLLVILLGLLVLALLIVVEVSKK